MALSLIAASLLAGIAEDADDEDKELYYTMAYLFRRHYSELRFYSSPTEGMRILQTPAASLSVIERTTNLMGQVFTDVTSLEFERYTRGPRKGETKLKRKVSQLSPIFGQLDRNIQDTYEWLSK